MESQEHEVEIDCAMEQTPISREVAAPNYRWLWLYALSFCCLIGISLSLRKAEPMVPVKDESILKLQAVVYRVLLAEEVAVDEEFEKSTTQLEQLITTMLSASPTKADEAQIKLYEKALAVLKSINNSDRKSAIETVIEFSGMLDELLATQFRAELVTTPRADVNWLALGSITLLAGCLVFAALRHSQLILNESHSVLERHIVADQNQQLSGEFEDERKRTTELHQRLMELGNKLRALENSNDEKVKGIASLESSLKAARAAMLAIDVKCRASESEFEAKNSECEMLALELRTSRLEMDSLQGKHVEEHEAQSKIILELKTLASNYAQKINELENKLEEMRQIPVRPSMDIDHEVEQKVATEMQKLKSSFESDLSILEWRNSKLVAECEQLGKDLIQTKDDALAQARQFRTMIADSEIESEKAKKLAMRDLGDRYESELRRLREDLRSATQEIDHLKLGHRAV